MDYLTNQIITYIGNKRLLIPYIENIVKKITNDNFTFVDLFSGSGIVARLFKQYGDVVIANDLEDYSRVINQCYLSNKEEFDKGKYLHYKNELNQFVSRNHIEGIISKHYAPKDTNNINFGERAFYTRENAILIDTIRYYIDCIPCEMQKYFLAPLIYEASVHTNTGGVFKGFYKDKNTGIGKFGGFKGDALSRITKKIELPDPIFSPRSCNYKVFQLDANKLVQQVKADVVYIDPPYNQHPYGSNYFMLNLIANNKLDEQSISKISGIPNNWNRSRYNKKNEAIIAFQELINDINAKYCIISYNSEGFISYNEMVKLLENYGKLETQQITYNAYRASRNLHSRAKYVKEYLFLLTKG